VWNAASVWPETRLADKLAAGNDKAKASDDEAPDDSTSAEASADDQAAEQAAEHGAR
jgi:hypothetical protein